jgi:hypothetical protein
MDEDSCDLLLGIFYKLYLNDYWYGYSPKAAKVDFKQIPEPKRFRDRVCGIEFDDDELTIELRDTTENSAVKVAAAVMASFVPDNGPFAKYWIGTTMILMGMFALSITAMMVDCIICSALAAIIYIFLLTLIKTRFYDTRVNQLKERLRDLMQMTGVFEDRNEILKYAEPLERGMGSWLDFALQFLISGTIAIVSLLSYFF